MADDKGSKNNGGDSAERKTPQSSGANNTDGDGIQQAEESNENAENQERKDNENDIGLGTPKSASEDQTVNEGESSEEVGEQTQKAVKSTLKKVASNVLEVLKVFIKGIKESFKIHPILGVVVLAIIFLLVLLKTYLPEFSISDSSVSSTDTQAAQNISAGEIKDSNYLEYSQKMKEILYKYGDDELLEEILEFKKEANQNNIIRNIVSDTSNNIDLYNTDSGYQILNQEAILLLYLERLSYAFTELEWKPQYGIITDEDIYYKEYNRISRELNTNFNNKISSKMTGNNDINTYPTGQKIIANLQNIPQENVVAYYKKSSGLDTTEIRDKISYFHKLLTRKREYTITISDETLDCPNLQAWLNKPELSDLQKNKDTVEYKNLQDIEEAYKLSYELIHHETTLKNAIESVSKNSIFKDEALKETLEKTISLFMPMFEYATYSDTIGKKTFFDYELYNTSSFDNNGNYILPDKFKTKFYKLANEQGYDIDYSIVEKVRMKEAELENIDTLLETVYTTASYERDLKVEEREKILEQIQYKDGEYIPNEKYGKTKELEKEYTEKAEKLEKVLLDLGNDSTRPYDAHNHNVFVDTDNYYLNRYTFYDSSNNILTPEYINDYNELITINCSAYYMTDGNTNLSSTELDGLATLTVSSNIHVTNSQNSLQPVRFQSIFINMNYSYNKEEEKDETLISRLKAVYGASTWQKVTESTIDADGNPKEITHYYRSASVTGTNYGRMVANVVPGTENVDNEIVIDEDLKEYYGIEHKEAKEISGKAYVGFGSQIVGTNTVEKIE